MKLFEEFNTPFLLNVKGEGIKNAFMKKSYIDGFEEIIERKVKEALLKALMEIAPYVSDKEQEEIEKIAGKPEDYDENEFEAWNGQ